METEKEIPKGKDPKVPVRQKSQIIRYATILRRKNATKNSHAMIGTHQNAHTTNPDVDATGRIRAHSSTQEKSVKTKVVLAQKLEEPKELNCVLKDGQGNTFATRFYKKIGWPPTEERFRVRCCRSAERHFRTREKRSSTGNYSLDLIDGEKKKHFGNEENLVRLLRQMGQSPRQKKLLCTSKIWTCLLQSNFWNIHQLCSRLGKCAKNTGNPMNGSKDNRPH